MERETYCETMDNQKLYSGSALNLKNDKISIMVEFRFYQADVKT